MKNDEGSPTLKLRQTKEVVMLAKNFQVAIRIPVARQFDEEIVRDDKREVRLDKNIDPGGLRPYVREKRRFCLN